MTINFNQAWGFVKKLLFPSRFYESINLTILSTVILVSVTLYINTEQKRLEIRVNKETRILEQNIQASKNIMNALSKLNNYIQYDLENEELSRLKSSEFYDELLSSEKQFTPLPNLESKLKETTQIVEENSIFLDKELYNEINEFMADTNELVWLYFSNHIGEKTLKSISPQLKDNSSVVNLTDDTRNEVHKSVSALTANYTTSYQAIKNSFRKNIEKYSYNVELSAQ